MPVGLAPAIFHPHGNRGADLIETIRLERLAGSDHVFTRTHPAVDETKRIPIRPASGSYQKMWKEPSWKRPASAMPTTCRVHSGDALGELLAEPAPVLHAPQHDRGSNAPSPLPGSAAPGSTAPSPFGSGLRRPSESGSAASSAVPSSAVVPTVKRRPHSAVTIADARGVLPSPLASNSSHSSPRLPPNLALLPPPPQRLRCARRTRQRRSASPRSCSRRRRRAPPSRSASSSARGTNSRRRRRVRPQPPDSALGARHSTRLRLTWGRRALSFRRARAEHHRIPLHALTRAGPAGERPL